MAASLQLPADLNLPAEVAYVRKDYLWLDVDSLSITKPIRLSRDSRVLITARTVRFEPAAYLQVVQTPGGKSSSGVDGQSLSPQCAALPTTNQATILIFAESFEIPSASGVLHDSGAQHEDAFFVVRAHQYRCGSQACDRASLAGFNADMSKTPVRDLEEPALLDAIRRLVRWPDLTYQRIQSQFALSPYDLQSRERIVRDLVELRDLKAYELRAPLLFRIQDSLELVRAGRNLFGQDQYFLPTLRHELLEQFLADELSTLGPIGGLNGQIQALEDGLSGVSNNKEFIKGRLAQIAARRTILHQDEPTRAAMFDAAASNVQITQDALTDQKAAYDLAVQHEKWNQERLQRKAADRAKTAQFVTTAAVATGALATGGVGGTAMAAVASTAQPLAAAYSAYADAQTSFEICGKRRDFFKSIGFAIDKYKAIDEDAKAVSQQLKSSTSRLKDISAESRCYATNSRRDTFEGCFKQATADNRKAAQEGTLQLPSKYGSRERVQGLFSRSRDMAEEVERLRDLQWQQPISLPECPQGKPMPKALVDASEAYLKAQAQAETAVAKLGETETELSKIDSELVALADLEAALT